MIPPTVLIGTFAATALWTGALALALATTGHPALAVWHGIASMACWVFILITLNQPRPRP